MHFKRYKRLSVVAKILQASGCQMCTGVSLHYVRSCKLRPSLIKTSHAAKSSSRFMYLKSTRKDALMLSNEGGRWAEERGKDDRWLRASCHTAKVDQRMSAFEQLFTACSLQVAVPDTSLDFPDSESIDEWLKSVQSGNVERKQAFFGASTTVEPNNCPIINTF